MLFTGVHSLYKLGTGQGTALDVGTLDIRTRSGGPPLPHHTLR